MRANRKMSMLMTALPTDPQLTMAERVELRAQRRLDQGRSVKRYGDAYSAIMDMTIRYGSSCRRSSFALHQGSDAVHEYHSRARCRRFAAVQRIALATETALTDARLGLTCVHARGGAR